MTRMFLILLIALVPVSASAHGAHWGELAGHSHALVWAVAIAAAALAALLAVKNDESSEEADEEIDAEAEAA